MITVFIPVYNNATTLKTTLLSLEKQQKPLIDAVIINDDGSKDNSLDIIKDIARKSKYKYIIHRGKNQLGLAEKYNQIVESISSPLLLIMHADIRIKNDDAIQRYAAVFSNPNVIAATSYIQHLKTDWQHYSYWQKVEFDRLLGRTHHGMMGKFDIFRVSTLKKIGGFNTIKYRRAGEDWDIFFRLGQQGDIRPIKNYYVHQHSFEAGYGLKKLFYRQALYSEAMGVILRNHWKKFSLKRLIFALFREILLLSAIISIFVWYYFAIWWPLVLVIGTYLYLSYAYTKNLYHCKFDIRIFILPFVNIALSLTGNYYLLRGFIVNRQVL